MLNYLKWRGYSLFPALLAGSQRAAGAENCMQERVRGCEGEAEGVALAPAAAEELLQGKLQLKCAQGSLAGGMHLQQC